MANRKKKARAGPSRSRRKPAQKRAARGEPARRRGPSGRRKGDQPLEQVLSRLERAQATLTEPTPESMAALQERLEAVLLETHAAITGAVEGLRRAAARRDALKPRHK